MGRIIRGRGGQSDAEAEPDYGSDHKHDEGYGPVEVESAADGRCDLNDVHHYCQPDADAYAGQQAAALCLALAVRWERLSRRRRAWRGLRARCGG